MTKLYLIRHAPRGELGRRRRSGPRSYRPRASRSGRSTLTQSLDRLPIYTSPMRRCRETARPFERLWERSAKVFEPVAELPSPPLDLRARQEWLRQSMSGTWQELRERAPAGSPDYLAWRQMLLHSLAALPHDCVIFTHFIAINVAVAAAQAREDVVCFQPDHASVTGVEIENGIVQVVELGREARTNVLAR